MGKLIHFSASAEKAESFILELNMFPETKFGVFPDEPRTKSAPKDDFDGPSETIDAEDIPF